MRRVISNNGNMITLLNPAEKSRKYSYELKQNCQYTNNMERKCDSNGVVMCLSDSQRAYRAGYLNARSDSSKAYCKIHGILSKRKLNKTGQLIILNNRKEN